MMGETHYTPFVKVDFKPYWDLMFKPTTTKRYNPRHFHIGMFNEWTKEVCTEHKHYIRRYKNVTRYV